jgi:hypothetical protein
VGNFEYFCHREEQVKKKENDKQTKDDLNHGGCSDLQAVLQTATKHITNCSYKTKQFIYSCTVCDLQVEALSDVHCYLWHEM